MKTATMKYVRQETKVGPIYKRVGELPKGTSYVRVESTPPNPITNGCPSVFSVARIMRVLDEGAAKRQLKADTYTLIPVTNPATVVRADRPARVRVPKEKKPKVPKPEKVAGMYGAGSSLANMYLLLADGKVHTEAELKKQLTDPSADLKGRIGCLVREGPRAGKWTVNVLKGGRYQMILGVPKPVAKAAVKPKVKKGRK